MLRFIVCVSLLANGLMGGLILGHVMAPQTACRCEHRRRIGEEPVDRGPFPTGWVVPDDVPAKPSGEAQ